MSSSSNKIIKKEYYPSINFLRGIAALMVCLFHFINYADQHGNLFPTDGLTYQIGEYGSLGVYVFFIITGFVIPLSLMKYDFRLPQFHRFIAKRWVRIEIPYLASVLLVLLVGFAFSIKNQQPYELEWPRIAHHVLYTAPFFNYDWYNPIYWTLAIEMQFYLLIALLYPLLHLKRKVFNVIAPMLLAISAILIDDSRIVFHYGAIFSSGILLLLIVRNQLNPSLGLIGLLLCTLITYHVNGMAIAIVNLLTMGVIVWTNIDQKNFNRLGDISYSLYLTHGLIGVNLLYFTSRYADAYYVKWGLILGATIISILGAYFFWKFIERSSKKWSQKITLK